MCLVIVRHHIHRRLWDFLETDYKLGILYFYFTPQVLNTDSRVKGKFETEYTTLDMNI